MSIKEGYLMLDPLCGQSTIGVTEDVRPTQHCARIRRAIAGAIKEVA